MVVVVVEVAALVPTVTVLVVARVPSVVRCWRTVIWCVARHEPATVATMRRPTSILKADVRLILRILNHKAHGSVGDDAAGIEPSCLECPLLTGRNPPLVRTSRVRALAQKAVARV